MPHNNHVIDGVNADLVGKDLNYYLDLIGDYVSPYPDPVVKTHEGVRVVREKTATSPTNHHDLLRR